MTSRDELIRTTNGSVGEIPTIELKKKRCVIYYKTALVWNYKNICGIKQMMITNTWMMKSLNTNVSAA